MKNKKILLFMLCLVMVSRIAFPINNDYTSENITILGPYMGSVGKTPPTEIIKVNLGSDDSCAIGDVIMWDTASAATHGFSVRRCSISSASVDSDSTLGTRSTFAGVMVTTTSKDSSKTYATITDAGAEVGYMAIRGFAEAKCDASETAVGERLVLRGGAIVASFGTMIKTSNNMSEDIGICLETPTTDATLVDVWLR